VQLTHRTAFTTVSTAANRFFETTYLLANELSAIITPLRLLDNNVLRDELVKVGDGVQRRANTEKGEDFVDKVSVCHHNGTIIQGLLDRVVALFVVGWAASKDGELLVQVLVNDWK
jgi:hypothetical protein